MIQEGKVGKDRAQSVVTNEMRAKFEMFSKSAHNSNQALMQAQNKSTNLVERIRSYTLIERGANKSQALQQKEKDDLSVKLIDKPHLSHLPFIAPYHASLNTSNEELDIVMSESEASSTYDKVGNFGGAK